MANYVHVENNVITEYHDKLPTSWRHVSGLNLLSKPELLALGWYWVDNLSDFHNPDTHYIAGYNYEILDDYVKQIPDIRMYTAEELAERAERHREEFFNQLRSERNRKLAECDWTQLLDIQALHTAEWISAWATYRQALRDLPETYADTTDYNLSNVSWPAPPQ